MFNYLAQIQNCAQGDDSPGCLVSIPTPMADGGSLGVILGIVFGVIGAMAVIVIIIQGIRFVLSSGDPQKAAEARKGIIYAIVGLAVALSAEVVVQLVLGRL